MWLKTSRLILRQSSSLRVSFYFSNIRENLQYVDLRKGLKVCGMLSDVFVSRFHKRAALYPNVFAHSQAV